MKRQWRVRRQMRPAADGARRWDRAYLLVLGWGTSDRPAGVPGTGHLLPDERRRWAMRRWRSTRGCRRSARRRRRPSSSSSTRLRAHVAVQGVGARRGAASSATTATAGRRWTARGWTACATRCGAGEVDLVLVTDRPTGWRATTSSRWWCWRSSSAPGVPGGVPRPAGARRPARAAGAPDPRRGGRVRAHPHRRPDAPRPAGGAAGRAPAALGRAPYGYRLHPERPRDPAARPGRRGGGGRRAGAVRRLRRGRMPVSSA